MARAAALVELPQGELLRAHDPRRRNEHDVVLIAFLEGGPGDATFGAQEKELRKSAKRFARSVHHDYISSGGASARMYGQASSYFGLGESVLRGGTAIAMDSRAAPADWSIPHHNYAALPTASPMKFRLDDAANCTRKALRGLLDAVARRFDGSASSADALARYAFVKSAPVPAAAEETAAAAADGAGEGEAERAAAPRSNVTEVVADTFGPLVLADDGSAVLLRLTGSWCAHCALDDVASAMEGLLAVAAGEGGAALGAPVKVMSMDAGANDVPHPRLDIRGLNWRNSIPFVLFAPGKRAHPVVLARDADKGPGNMYSRRPAGEMVPSAEELAALVRTELASAAAAAAAAAGEKEKVGESA